MGLKRGTLCSYYQYASVLMRLRCGCMDTLTYLLLNCLIVKVKNLQTLILPLNWKRNKDAKTYVSFSMDMSHARYFLIHILGLQLLPMVMHSVCDWLINTFVGAIHTIGIRKLVRYRGIHLQGVRCQTRTHTLTFIVLYSICSSDFGTWRSRKQVAHESRCLL